MLEEKPVKLEDCPHCDTKGIVFVSEVLTRCIRCGEDVVMGDDFSE